MAGENQQEKQDGRDSARGGTQLDLATVSRDTPTADPTTIRPDLDEMVTRPSEGQVAATEMKQLIDLASARDAAPRPVAHDAGLHGVMFTEDSPGAVKENPSPVARVSATAPTAETAITSLPPADTVLGFAKKNFDEIDANKDKFVTEDELGEYIKTKKDLTGQQVAELTLLKDAVGDVEEVSNDEDGDENDGVTTKDLENVIEHLSVVDYAERNFDKLDTDGDGHVNSANIDEFLKQHTGKLSTAELEMLQKVKEQSENLEEHNDDEFGDENDGFTRHDLAAARTEYGVLAFKAMEPAVAENGPPTMQEVLEYANEENFKKFDKDGDGHLTTEDINQYISDNKLTLTPRDVAKLEMLRGHIDNLEEQSDDETGDENDGVTRADIAESLKKISSLEYVQDHFHEMDGDADGHITEEEIDGYRRARGPMSSDESNKLNWLKDNLGDLEEYHDDEISDEDDGFTKHDVIDSLAELGANRRKATVDRTGQTQQPSDTQPTTTPPEPRREVAPTPVPTPEPRQEVPPTPTPAPEPRQDVAPPAPTPAPRREATPAVPPTPEPRQEVTPAPTPETEQPQDRRRETPPPPETERPAYPRTERWGRGTFRANEDGSADYQVKRGDNLWRIAKDVLRHRNGQEPNAREIVKMVGQIVDASNSDNDRRNDVHDPERIYPGQVLKIPAGERRAAPETQRPQEVTERPTPGAEPRTAPRGPYDYHQGDVGDEPPQVRGRQREASPLHDPNLEGPPQPTGRVNQDRVPFPQDQRGQNREEWPQYERPAYPYERPAPNSHRRVPVPEDGGRPPIPDGFKGPRGRREPQGEPQNRTPQRDVPPTVPPTVRPDVTQPAAPPTVPPDAPPRQEVQQRQTPEQPVSIFKFLADNFKEFDPDGDGHITADDIDKTIEKNKGKLSPTQIAKLQKVKERVEKLEELSNDESGDENDGIHAEDLKKAMEQEEALNYATKNFDNLDVDGDGHVSEDDIDSYTRARLGQIDANEMEKLKLLKGMVDDLEESNDDETGDENDGFSRHDLLEYAKANGLDADDLGAATAATQENRTAGMPTVTTEAGYLTFVKENFKEFDADNDGHLTNEEIDQFVQKNKDKLGAEGIAVFERIKQRAGNLEELSNDESGDENDGITIKDIDAAVEGAMAVEYAKRTFASIDTNNDGHVTAEDIDAYVKANGGRLAPPEAELLKKLKARVEELEEAHDDEFGDENDGFTQHDLIAAAKELGLN